jgi:hypothetical protein
MNELLGYLLLNTDVPGFNLPIHQIALALTLIKGSRVDRWVRDMTVWLRSLDPIQDNVPRVWNYFTEEFESQFTDSTKTQRSRQQPEKLQFRFPEIDQYIANFEDLVNLSGYTVGNNETINLFLKGFENARDVLGGILSLLIPVTYYAIKEQAISITKSRQLINAIQRNAPGGFGAFRPAQSYPPPRRGNYPPRPQNQYAQRQYNSTNAPPWLNNTPVPMDTSARTRAPPYQGGGYLRGRGEGQRTYRNVAQTDPPPPCQKGLCFRCGKEGHFTREC